MTSALSSTAQRALRAIVGIRRGSSQSLGGLLDQRAVEQEM